MAPDSSDKPPRRLALPTQLPPRWAAIIASMAKMPNTSWADAMREELSCPICMDAVEQALQVPVRPHSRLFSYKPVARRIAARASRVSDAVPEPRRHGRGRRAGHDEGRLQRQSARRCRGAGAGADVAGERDAEDGDDGKMGDDGDEDVMEDDDGTA